ncbi:MAG: hypothetical protein DWH91_16775 [Planctomycetota bacterium]|nr:MAG: hypothetical protein DWH91_16775 [Planctomycetota bacterium]
MFATLSTNTPHVESQPADTSPPLVWREWLVLVAICLLGAGLRLYRMDRLAIEHFDEGVYAANHYTELSGFRYPNGQLYAPPLFPKLCEFAVVGCGMPDGAIAVNLLFGILTVPLVWRVGRSLAGPVGGVVASTLAAMSDYHVFYSRSALTDVTLGFWLLLAVWWASRAMQSGHRVTMGLAGLAAALAWWTKYNGWLAILIPLGGWGVLSLVQAARVRGGLRSRWAVVDRPGLTIWFGMAIMAGALWSPVWYDLQVTGGYGPVAANHGKYLVGWSGWGEALTKQIVCHGRLTSSLGTTAPAVAAGLAVYLGGRWGVAALLIGLHLLMPIGAAGALGLLSVGIVVWLAVSWMRESDPRQLLEAMLVTWWIGLTITTPLYTPYPRLSLPWLVVTWLLVGALAGRIQRHATGDHSQWALVAVLSLPAMVFLPMPKDGPWFSDWWTGRALSRGPAWEDRTSLRKAVESILHEIEVGLEGMPPSDLEAAAVGVYVLGEPAFFCHLAHAARDWPQPLIAQPASSMQVTAPKAVYVPSFVVTGAHAPPDEVAAELAAGRIELIWEQRVPVSEMVVLDAATLDQLVERGLKKPMAPEKTITLRLYRIKPPSAVTEGDR